MSTDSMIKRLVKSAIGDNAFVNFVSGLGTVRDKASSAKYMPVRRLSVKELNDIYHSDPSAKRIITKPASDAISAGWYYGKLDTDSNQAIINLSRDLKLKKVLLSALTLSRLHGWAYILIGADGGDGGNEELMTPLDVGFGDLSFFTVLKRDEVKARAEAGFVSADITKGRFKEPEYYQIGNDFNPCFIHHTRIIRIDSPDPVTADDGLPMPVLQHIQETLLRHVGATANAASLIYEAKTDIIRVPDLMKNMANNPTGTVNSLIQRFTGIATLKGNNGMIVLDKNEEYDSKHFAFGGLSDLIREFRVETAGAAEMPYSLLFGQSPSGLNATGSFDIQTYFGGISTMQENVLRDPIEEIILVMAKSLGIGFESLGLVFNPVWNLDEKTRSEVERSNADRDAIYLERGVITEYHVAQQLVDDGTYTTIDDDHIKLLSQLETIPNEPIQ